MRLRRRLADAKNESLEHLVLELVVGQRECQLDAMRFKLELGWSPGWWGAGWQVGRARGRKGYGAASHGAAAAEGAAWCGKGGLQLFADGRTN